MTPHPQRCEICGAEILHTNVNLCKNFHIIRSSQQSGRESIPHQCFGIARDDEDDTCENCDANSQCFAASELFKERQSGRDVKELFRKEIAKWKDEDPLFMAYVYGQEAGTAEECEKNLELIEKEINEYTEYWLQQSGYTVLLYLQNGLRQSKDGE